MKFRTKEFGVSRFTAVAAFAHFEFVQFMPAFVPELAVHFKVQVAVLQNLDQNGVVETVNHRVDD
jgi:hypothetical protein